MIIYLLTSLFITRMSVDATEILGTGPPVSLPAGLGSVQSPCGRKILVFRLYPAFPTNHHFKVPFLFL